MEGSIPSFYMELSNRATSFSPLGFCRLRGSCKIYFVGIIVLFMKLPLHPRACVRPSFLTRRDTCSQSSSSCTDGRRSIQWEEAMVADKKRGVEAMDTQKDEFTRNITYG